VVKRDAIQSGRALVQDEAGLVRKLEALFQHCHCKGKEASYQGRTANGGGRLGSVRGPMNRGGGFDTVCIDPDPAHC
jgi:hypothetical protein